MKMRIAFAFCIVLLLPYVLVQAFIIRTDDRLLAAIKGLCRGMSADEVAALIMADVPGLMVENNVADHPKERYVIRLYMGLVTSRNLLIFFDDDKRVSFVSWETT